MQDTIQISNIDATAFEPYMTPDGAEGEIHWISKLDVQGVLTQVGIWRGGPTTVPEALPVTFGATETVQILSGQLDIELVDEGRTLAMKAGDIATFPKSTKTIWKIRDEVRTLLFIAG